ncbi:hypothetical protein [Mycolicibacterium obuense]|uniref:Uncharacterized protein n=1 Tax=Mycolicibacterium obuense TaxID=1807 RepID=A0A0M2K3Y7_9MYCO|nr:hypothetical protein [Mycolicibacterium obuense]KKF01940.1 hypothetical protein WN67_11035 [Mycolicibacterium obuense]
MQLANAQAKDLWRTIGAHCSSRHSIAPWRVQSHAAILLGDHEVTGSAVHFQTGDDRSSWTVQMTTADGRLIMLNIEFEHERYDRDEEQQPIHQHQPVKATVIEAWSRRLRDAAALDILSAQSARDAFQQPVFDRVDVGELRLKFNDGASVALVCDQTAMYDPDEKSRADVFVAAIREHSGL